jgi:hypothetical protein
MLASATVLVVENDPITRELLEGVLRTAGCQVLAVPTGNAGLLADEYHQHNPDRPVIMLSEAILEAECPSIDAIFVPPHAPTRVLEVLKGLVGPKPISPPSIEMQRAA